MHTWFPNRGFWLLHTVGLHAAGLLYSGTIHSPHTRNELLIPRYGMWE